MHLLDEATTLVAAQRWLKPIQRERDAAYGFTSAAAEPIRAAEVQNRGTAIDRALDAVPPVYDTAIKNMCAVEANAEGLELLEGEELRERLQRMHELLGAANA